MYRGEPIYSWSCLQYWYLKTSCGIRTREPKNRQNLYSWRVVSSQVYLVCFCRARLTYHRKYEAPRDEPRLSSWQRAPTLRRSWHPYALKAWAWDGPICKASAKWAVVHAAIQMMKMKGKFRRTSGACVHSLSAFLTAVYMTPQFSMSPK